MNKEEWKNLYEFLDNCLKQFIFGESELKRAKNKKSRDEATKKIDRTIDAAVSKIKKNVECYELVTGKNSNALDRHFNLQETELPNFFKYDMEEYLKKINDKIESLSE